MTVKILFFCLFFSFQMNGQTSTIISKPNSLKKGLSNAELKIACDKFKLMMTTEAYKIHEEKTKTFAKKMGSVFLEAPSNFYEIEVFIPWLEKNITKTNFTSMQEAKVFIEDMALASGKMLEENKELFELISKATIEQIVEIRKPFRSF